MRAIQGSLSAEPKPFAGPEIVGPPPAFQLEVSE
jgi:hypothetical protein